MHFAVAAFRLDVTFGNNFRVIGQGPDNNLSVHANLHMTVNSNGALTSFVDNFSLTCQESLVPKASYNLLPS